MTTLSLGQVKHLQQTAASFNAVTLYKVEVKVDFENQKISSMFVKGGGKETTFNADFFAGKGFNQIVKILVDAFCAATEDHNNA